VSEQPIGSYYGEDLYSADLYSWEVGWDAEVCDPISRVPAYVPPAVVSWPGAACAPGMVARETYRPPPTANWSSSGCAPLTVR